MIYHRRAELKGFRKTNGLCLSLRKNLCALHSVSHTNLEYSVSLGLYSLYRLAGLWSVHGDVRSLEKQPRESTGIWGGAHPRNVNLPEVG